MALGRLARQSRCQLLGQKFRDPRAGTKERIKLADCDEATGRSIAELLFTALSPEGRYRIVEALRNGQTDSIKVVLDLLLTEELMAIKG